MLRKGGERYASVEKYTSYEVTVHLAGKERTYKALVLYFNQNVARRKEDEGPNPETTRANQPSAEVLDNVISEMNAVLNDESPQVRSPWNKYVNTSLYSAVVRTIKASQAAGQPLRPANAPIGYLPGDDVTVTKLDSQMLSVNCPPPIVITDVSPPEVHVSTGDNASAHGITVAFTPGDVSATISFVNRKLGNPGGTSDAALAIPSKTGNSPIGTTVKASAAGASIASLINPTAGGSTSSLQTIVIVPPQILIQMMHNEAGGLSSGTVRQFLGFALQNRFSDNAYFSGQTTYQAAVTAGATHDSTASGIQPELDAAVTVFWDTSGGGDLTHGCQGFWSPTNAQWTTINQALTNQDTTLPSNTGIPFTYNGHPEITQIVYFSSVGLNTTVPGKQNAPSFVFVRKRDANAGLPAVVRLD